MEKQRSKSKISAAERAQIFHEQYDSHFDPAEALSDFVLGAGDYLACIVGEEEADAGMAQIVKRVVEVAGGEIKVPSEWRVALKENSANCFSEFEIGASLHDLGAYAEYGIVLHSSEDPDELSAHLQNLLERVEELEAKTPIAEWGINPENTLTQLLLVARNRWALDNSRPVEPAALAFFGGLSEGTIRNMMSGANSKFKPVNGFISAAQAMKWLVGRQEFWNSIWREQSLPQYETGAGDPVETAIFIPVSRDCSTFHPELRRGQSYTIGKKGEEIQVADFEDALAELQKMPTPYWRRPNSVGNWGVVAGIRWERFDAKNFKNGPTDKLADENTSLEQL